MVKTPNKAAIINIKGSHPFLTGTRDKGLICLYHIFIENVHQWNQTKVRY